MIPTPQKILIVKLGSLGDIVHSLPVLRTLRVHFPQAHISWLVEERGRDILDQNPDLDEIITVRTRYWRKHLDFQTFREIRSSVRNLRSRNFDLALDLQGLIKSGVICRLTGARYRVGFALKNCREWPGGLLLNRRAPFFGENAHVVEKNLSLLKLLGIHQFHYSFPIHVPEESEAYIDGFLKNHPDLSPQRMVAVNPGVGFKSKRWDLKKFAQLADRIAGELGGQILLTWGPGEMDQIETISRTMTQPKWIAPPTTVPQSFALYRRLRLFVGCDTGPLHLCSALEVPTVSVFGPTDPVRNGAYGDGHTAVFHRLTCSFCYKRACPTQNECMEGVTVQEVFEAVKKSFYNP